MQMSNTETGMRSTVKDLFAKNEVDVVIGFRSGSRPKTSRPYFVRHAAEIDRLVWNQYCISNVAAFLPRLFVKPARPPKDFRLPRVGIIAKGCDARSIAGLVKEKQVPRENVVIIGMPCQGMISVSKTEKNAKPELARACVECVSPTTHDADITIPGESRKPAKPAYARIKAFEAKPAAERWKIFMAEMAKCIRCNACREACPNCYCKVCFADQRKPSWVSPANELSDTIVYHLGRMFHQAGRCVECDACVNACPMGIDLRLFTQKLAFDTTELFGCVPGVTDDSIPPFYTFKQDDSQVFMTDPEAK
jgi:formate dehydrogenase subunit beta